MNKIAIALLTKDRTDLSVQSIQPLLQPDKFDLFWIDGSNTSDGEQLPLTYPLPADRVFHNVRGGPDAAIVFALTTMLNGGNVYKGKLGQFTVPYDYVGIVEQDVLLDPDWFQPTMDLFGLPASMRVGAVSPRAYEDRILIQRSDYAIMHNLGAGCVIFTREAAQIVLANYRTGFSIDNRTVFNQRSGIDIGSYWAFRGNMQWLTADWHFDVALARAGLCSLALTPAKCQMIGQNPPLEQQGLKLANDLTRVSALRGADDTFFANFQSTSGQNGITAAPSTHYFQGQWTLFPHQIHRLGAVYEGDWRLKWAQGYGPFAWESSSPGDSLVVPLSGVCEMLVSGGKNGGQVELVDLHSGYSCSPNLSPEGAQTAVMQMALPCGVSYRKVRLTALSPGVVFYGIRTGEPQVLARDAEPFDHSILPPPG